MSGSPLVNLVMLRAEIIIASSLLVASCSASVEGPPQIEEIGDGSLEYVTTRTLSPTPIRIGPDDLPEPFATPSAVRRADVLPVPSAPLLDVPDGFKVNIFAGGLSAPRSMAVAPGGDVFVTESSSNRIRVLRDSTGDGDADLVSLFADESNGLFRPFGLVFANQSLYVAGTTEIRRFTYQPGQLHATGSGEVVSTFGGSSGHWTRDLVLSKEGDEMFVSVGSASNVSVESPPRATVQRMRLDGSYRRTMAAGMRNPVGLAVHPQTGSVYVVVNERDGLGDDLVPDYLARLEPGDFYGWPYAYLKPEFLDPRRMRDGLSESPALASSTKTPAVLFQAHSSPLGLTFYDGSTFPPKYRNGAFVAFHGSWNRSLATGYKIVYVPFDSDGTPIGYYEDFLTGFLLSETNARTWGRPVGLTVLPDGSLLVSDDANGMIFRIQYYP